MGLISDAYGYKRSIELVFDICKKAYEIKETDRHLNFTLASNFNCLSQENKRELIDYLSSQSTLQAYQSALLPLTKLYKDSPLSFLDTEDGEFDHGNLISKMKESIRNHIDKYKTPSLVIQANVIYVRGATGGLHIAEHIQVPDLNVLIDAPESEQAKKAEGFVRTSVMSEFMPMGEERDEEWPRAFWNQGYLLDKCDFSWETDELN